jgi:hypothetical protein
MPRETWGSIDDTGTSSRKTRSSNRWPARTGCTSDVSTRAGQDFWSFSNPKATTKGRVQALKDVVRTSEVMIRGRIPGEAIEPL